MPLLPVARAHKITFFKIRLAPWAEEAGALGLDAAEVARLAELVAAADEAKAAQLALRDSYRAATSRYKRIVRELCGQGSGMIQSIRATAQAAGTEHGKSAEGRVWTRAMLPAPRRRGRLAPPGTPTSFKVELGQTGMLRLRWSCKNPKGSKGTMYEIARGEGLGAPMKFLATVGRKTFDDETVPRGVRGGTIVYAITAVRSTARGGEGRFAVNLGAVNAAVDAETQRRAA